MRLRNIPGAGDIIDADPLCVNDPGRFKGKWDTLFGNKNDIHLEIGCGKGKFLLDISGRNPDINYIGIEMYSSVLLRGVQKARALIEEGKCLSNLRFIRLDARELENVFAAGEIKRIYLNFSDPWPKERHHKRRLTSEGFLSIYENILTDGGRIEFKTDNAALFGFSLEEIKKKGWEMISCTYDLYGGAESLEENVPSEYEIRFAEKGEKIMKLAARP